MKINALPSKLAAEQRIFLEDLQKGLRQSPKKTHPKYFYDARGSQLFDAITALPEYYPTRTERAIMHDHIDAMGARIGPEARLVELGSGSSDKTRVLLDHLDCPVAYVPIDISRTHLLETAARLQAAYPALAVQPVVADYSQPVTLPAPPRPARRTVAYYPGSTIGNFDPAEARRFLERIANLCGAEGGLLIGIDLKKDRAVLEAAYNDAAGVTAAFNLNLLARINRELGADFDLDAFEHAAWFNEDLGRIEMHLRSLKDQQVTLGGERFTFKAGETIHTESSYKYTLAQFQNLAHPFFEIAETWTDPQNHFAVLYCTTTNGAESPPRA